MTLQHPFILNVLQQVSTDRLQRAVNALVDGSTTITVTRHTKSELRALVKNGDGHEYGVTLTASLTTCSCNDALYRGVVCKHATAAALSQLRSSYNERPTQRMIHLVSHTGLALCGVNNLAHCWKWPYWPESAWAESCKECEARRKQSVLRTMPAVTA